MTCSINRRAALPLLVAGIVTTALAGDVRVQQPQAPVFKAEVDLIAVDVNVLGSDGRPVATLGPADFQVTIDGKARRVVSAQFVAQRQASGPTPTAVSRLEGEEAVEATYASNQGGSASATVAPASRSVIIAIDQSTFALAATRGLVDAASGLLESLSPLDRVGLMAFPQPGPAVAPSVNHQRVKAALAQIGGLAEPQPRILTGVSLSESLSVSRGDPSELDKVFERVCAGADGAASLDGRPSGLEVCRRQLTADVQQYTEYAQRGSTISLQEIRGMMRLLAVVPGPKTVVLISAGLIAGEHAAALGTLDEVKRIAELAALAQASLYVIYVEGSFFDANSMERQRLTGFAQDGPVREAGLQHVATLAGGPVFRLGAGSRTAFSRVAQELSGYYLLGVESQPVDRDGQAHPIRVRVSRPNTTVRAREQVLVPRARAALSGDAAVLAALKSPGVERDLPIRLSAQVLRGDTSDRVRLVLSAGIGKGVRDAATVRLAYSITSGAGNAAESGVESRRLPLIGSGDDASLSFVDTVLLTPSRYRIRLAAADATGRLGSIEHEVTAGLVNGDGALLSDLILVDPTRVSASGLSPLSDGRIWSDRLDAYLEIYPVGTRTITSAKFEVAERADSAPLVSFDTPVKEVDAGRRWSVQGGIDLSALPPGAYTLVARVFDGARPVGVVVRPFRFEGVAASLARGGPRLPFSMATAGGLIRSFSREDALRPDAVNFFLGRLQAAETQAAPPAVAQAVDAVRAGKYDDALVGLVGVNEPALSASFLRGVALFSKGQLESAAGEFRAALRTSNEFLPAAFYLGACYAAGGRDREAVGAWQTSLVTESESRIVYDVLADGWLRLNNGVQAESILREAMGRWPGDDSFVPRLAAALAIRQQRNDAMALLVPYLERRPDDAEALFLAMRLLYDAYAEGKTVRTGAEDADLAVKYAGFYRDAKGPNATLVDRWAAFVRQKGGAKK
jgi:VWFA-related protein